MSALDIHDATPEDAALIDALLEAAFPSRAEAGLVAALRAAGDLAAEHVAEIDGEILGHAAFPRLTGAASSAAAALAPVAVRADARRRGVGAALIQNGLMVLAGQGFDWRLVLGDPAYYGRFGFSAERAEGFRTPYDGPYQQAVALKLDGPPAEGALGYPAAFAALG